MDKQISEWGFDIDDAQAIEWLAEFLAHTKVGLIMENKTCYIPICDGRGDLPSDMYKVVQTAFLDCIDTIEQAECGEGVIIPMRWSTDNFHDRYHRDDRDYTTESAHTYTIGQGFIFTSFSKGFVAMAIEAIPTDEDGSPLIPAGQSWLEAAAHYLAFKMARKRWMQDGLSDKKFQLVERDKEWYFAQAVNSTKIPSNVDQAESEKNSILRTIPDTQAHSSFFANFQLPEKRKFRNSISNATSSPGKVTQSKSNIA